MSIEVVESTSVACPPSSGSRVYSVPRPEKLHLLVVRGSCNSGVNTSIEAVILTPYSVHVSTV